MKNLKFIFTLLLLLLLSLLYIILNLLNDNPENCKYIVEINQEEKNLDSLYLLYKDNSYGISSKFLIDEANNITYLETVITEGYYIKDVDYCVDELELRMIVTDVEPSIQTRKFHITPLKLDRSIKEVVILQPEELGLNPLDRFPFCDQTLEDITGKPINKKGSIIIGSK